MIELVKEVLRKFITPITFVGLSLIMISCGGGSDSNDGNSESSTESSKAYLIDSGVAGLEYNSPSHQGITGYNGEFTFEPGETISFSYYGLQLGSVQTTADSVVFTPLDLFSTTDINNQTVKNALVLMQSLDSDQNPSNGLNLQRIESPQSQPDLSNFDITSISFQNQIETELLNTFSISNLVSEQDAISHFNSTLMTLQATPEITGRWITRDAVWGDISAIYSFEANGNLILTEFHSCENNETYWAATEASARRNCTVENHNMNWQSNQLIGGGVTLSMSKPGVFLDSCYVYSSSAYYITATCHFNRPSSGTIAWADGELIRFERDVQSFSNPIINNQYTENVVSNGDLFISDMTFNSDGSGDYAYTGSGPGNSGNFTWSTSTTQLSISGIDNASQPFADTFTLGESFQGAFSAESSEGDSVLIPDYDSELVDGLMFFSLFSIYDGITGMCKGSYAFSMTGSTTSDGPIDRGTLRKVEHQGSSDDICEEPVGDFPSNLQQVDPPVALYPTDYGVSIDDSGAITLTRDSETQICWPVSYTTLEKHRHFIGLACSTDMGPVQFEIWRGA